IRACTARLCMGLGGPNRGNQLFLAGGVQMASIGENQAVELSESKAIAISGTAGDDRILPETRWAAIATIPFALIAFLILYVFPDRTAELFAWTIKPPMTPLLMGAGYATAVYFLSRLLIGKRWHWFAASIPPIAAFASLMGLSTLLHWDRFNHSHLSFYAWL